MDKPIRDKIIELIKSEVVPACGCTEPAAVSLCVAKATELLGALPDSITLLLSGNIIKNAMGVGIPGTGMIGLPIAVALGAICGKSEYGLEVLRDVNPDALQAGKRYVDENHIKIQHKDNAPSNLYIEVHVEADGHTACAVISGAHTNFVYLDKDGSVSLKKSAGSDAGAESHIKLDYAQVYEFAMTAPLEEIEFMLEAGEMNLRAAKEGLKQNYGHCLGALLSRQGKQFFGDTPLMHIVSMTSAACDARMGGAQVSVMSNSGSGNQGITATLPVLTYARDCNASHEQEVRALTLSSLTSIYIKQSLGRLSALCGCVVASTAASAGITYLMDGDYDRVCASIKNMVANLTGMICDGAKPSCAMKIASGVYTALMSAVMAINDQCVSSAEGIVDNDIDKTIRNLTCIGREAMDETDRKVLQIMVDK